MVHHHPLSPTTHRSLSIPTSTPHQVLTGSLEFNTLSIPPKNTLKTNDPYLHSLCQVLTGSLELNKHSLSIPTSTLYQVLTGSLELNKGLDGVGAMPLVYEVPPTANTKKDDAKG